VFFVANVSYHRALTDCPSVHKHRPESKEHIVGERNKTILVTGPTGQQGGSTARHLLSKGWSVRGLTQNPGNPAAQTLAEGSKERPGRPIFHLEAWPSLRVMV
jgi:hypothetical protein